ASPPAGAAILNRGILALLAESAPERGPTGPPEHSPGTDGGRFYAAPGDSVTGFRAASHSRRPVALRPRHSCAEGAPITARRGPTLRAIGRGSGWRAGLYINVAGGSERRSAR